MEARILKAAVAVAALAGTAFAADPVEYLDAKGVKRSCTSYRYVKSTTAAFEDGKWYVVKAGANVLRTNTIAVVGSAHLILCDGGVLGVRGGNRAAGVRVSGGNALTVYGQSKGTGLLKAVGDEAAAGIGGDDEDCACGSVTINGGTVRATGGRWAAGLGGGSRGAGGTVTVNRGTVTATGGGEGAGIGGGDYAEAGELTVNGGTVTATGGFYGAGIGGGSNGAGGTVTVNGGTVLAVGEYSPGIGGGFYGAGGTVTVNGGDVTALANDTGCGIGGGYEGAGGTVTVNGGTVKAIGAKSWGYGGRIYSGIGGGNGNEGRLSVASGVLVYAGEEASTVRKTPLGDGSIELLGENVYAVGVNYNPLVELPVGKTIKVVRKDLVGFKASTLPTGLKFDSTTGKFSGKVKTATVKRVAFSKGKAKRYMILRLGGDALVRVVTEGDGKVTPSSKTAAPGEKVTFTAKASKGSVFIGWSLLTRRAGCYLRKKFLSLKTKYAYKVGKDAEQVLCAEFITVGEDHEPSVDVYPQGSTSRIDADFPVEISVGVPVAYQVYVSARSLKKVEVSSLPPGLAYDAKTGVISGVPGKPGTFATTVYAENVSGRFGFVGLYFRVR